MERGCAHVWGHAHFFVADSILTSIPWLHTYEREAITMSRITEIVELYDILAEAEQLAGGKRLLPQCNGRMPWPDKGIYFFFETGENRSDSLVHTRVDSQHTQQEMRVVRVGTHALTSSSRATLWGRLRSHRGNANGGGNHRGSIFRLLLGEALMLRDRIVMPPSANWGMGSTAPIPVRSAEQPLELLVSQYFSNLPFVCLNVPDRQNRIDIEAYCIALLSNFNQAPAIDLPSASWLGSQSPRTLVRRSGLWNNNCVADHQNGFFIPNFVNDRIRPQLVHGT